MMGIALALSFFSFLFFALGPTFAHFRLLSPIGGFTLWALGGFLGMLSVIAATVVLFWKGWQSISSGLIPGALVAVVFLVLSAAAMRYPAINDITTDPEAPISFVEVVRTSEADPIEYSYPAQRFAPIQQEHYPEIQPLELEMPARHVFEILKEVASEMPLWRVTRIDDQVLVIEGVAESAIFRFKDDFVIHARPKAGKTVIQMRSRSRQGRSDLGANADRIRRFFSNVLKRSTLEVSD